MADLLSSFLSNPLGTYWSMRATQVGYPPKGITPNVQSNGVSTNDIQSALSQLTGSPMNVQQPVYPSGSFDVTPFKEFYDKAYEQLAPYYLQLLKEAGGDLNVALTNLETDYKTGKRITVEDFTNSMSSLGATFPKEQTQLAGNLNQRGIALTENSQGQTQYAGGGQAATEKGMLNEDQRLRAEAIQRNRQRGMETLAQKKLVGGETAQQQYRNTTEQQQAQHETAATNLGAQFQSADIAKKQAGISQAQMQAETGISGGSEVNPNDVGSIKAAHPGYNSWNDWQSIINDYKATGGIGK